MNPETQVADLLASSGATLKREKGHEVWLLPNGQKFTRAKTPGDCRAAANQLSDLRRALGVVDPERGQPGERRERKIKHAPMEQPRRGIGATVNGALQEKLLTSGFAYGALKEANRELELDVIKYRSLWKARRHDLRMAGDANARKRRQLKRVPPTCWWCKLKRLVRCWRIAQ